MTGNLKSLQVAPLKDWNDSGDGKAPNGSPKNCPITLTYRGQKTTLRPWDPSRCPLAAAIHNQLIHFPIRPKSNVFVIHCSLQSLSHISDTLGPLGRVIGVCSRDPQKQPKPETVHRFLIRHPNTTLIFEDVEEATLERYERLLSLPDDSRYAFLMALHPRLGENSPARLLKEDGPKLCKLIFDFLVCTTPAHIKSLVLWPWTGDGKDKDSGEDTQEFDKVPRHVQEIVINHTDILQRWRRPRKSGEKKHSEGENSDSHERIWVFLDIRTDTSSGGNLDMKLVNELAKIGLLAKDITKCTALPVFAQDFEPPHL
ncbi:flpA [Symbiodinium natans]|uniref:FlpA protein n=1 Tax=Symbiodinium natans TaxID=878477 RepID=A0A812QX90_9DINO|nr:flpA [Symbiodinium natans]